MASNELADVERRVALLLRKAEGTDNPHEAETFTAAAEKMMLRWGIEEARLRKLHNDSPARENIIKKDVTFEGRYARANVHLAGCVASGLGSLKTLFYAGDPTRVRVIIVGYESEVDHAIMLTQSLRVQSVRDMNQWWRDFTSKEFMTQHERFLARRQFLFAFADAVGNRLAALRKEAVTETGDTPGTEIALRDRSAEVKSKAAEMYPRTRAARQLAGSYHGRAEGAAAGTRADLGGGKLTGARQELGE